MDITFINETNIDSFAALLPKDTFIGETIKLGCVEDDEPCAVLVAEISDNIMYLRLIHTIQKKANKGAAKELIAKLCEIASELSIDAIYATFPMNAAMEHLMEVSGFSKLEEETEKTYTFDFAGLDMDKIEKMSADRKDIFSLGKVSPRMGNSIKESLDAVFGKQSAKDRLSEVYDPDLSMVCAEEEKLKGFLLCKKEKGNLTVRYLINLTKENKLALSLMKSFYEAVVENEPDAVEMKVRFRTANRSIVNFLEALVTTKIWEDEEIDTYYFFPSIYSEP